MHLSSWRKSEGATLIETFVATLYSFELYNRLVIREMAT